MLRHGKSTKLTLHHWFFLQQAWYHFSLGYCQSSCQVFVTGELVQIFSVFGWDSIFCFDDLLCFLGIRVFGLTKLGRRNEGCFPSNGPLQGANRSSVWWKWKALWMMNPICPLQIDDVSFVFACFLRRWWFEGALPFESRKLPATG